MILFFSDAHLGYRSHSSQDINGLFSAEKDIMLSLNIILEKFKDKKITMAIFGGDMTHTNTPSPETIRFIIKWLNDMNDVGKPVYIIPGNHDTSMYSNSMIFTKELALRYIHFIDTISDFSIPFGEWKIKFIPYIPNKTLKDKDKIINDSLLNLIETTEDKTIIVSHIQEFSSKIGSEGRMLSKGVYLMNTNVIENKNLLFLLGHMHMYQNYTKGNSRIVYSGSTTYMDASDLNTKKGYCTVDINGNVSFEEIFGTRRFIEYKIPDNVNPLDYLQSIRILNNSVAFVNYLYDEKLDLNEIRSYLRSKGSYVGNIKKRNKDKIQDNNIFVNSQKSVYDIFKDYVNEYQTEVNKNKLIIQGIKNLEKVII